MLLSDSYSQRISIDDVRPHVSGAASKAVVGEVVPVSALVWREGHDGVAATLNVWSAHEPHELTSSVTMRVDPLDPDRVHAVFSPATPGRWYFRISAWSDPMATWRNAVIKKMDAGQQACELTNDLSHGADLFQRAALQTPTDQAAILFDAASALSDASLPLPVRTRLALSDEVTELLHHHPLRDLLTEGDIHEGEETRHSRPPRAHPR